jgi:hypothetical protein
MQSGLCNRLLPVVGYQTPLGAYTVSARNQIQPKIGLNCSHDTIGLKHVDADALAAAATDTTKSMPFSKSTSTCHMLSTT